MKLTLAEKCFLYRHRNKLTRLAAAQRLRVDVAAIKHVEHSIGTKLNALPHIEIEEPYEEFLIRRRRAGLSQMDLQRARVWSHVTVTHYERGRLGAKPHILAKLRDFLRSRSMT